jgi:hypothetical protein
MSNRLVEKLEDLLASAKKGDITGIHYFAVKRADSDFSWGYVNMGTADLSMAAVAAHKHASDMLHRYTDTEAEF